jgi:predicted metal-binding membrane protein
VASESVAEWVFKRDRLVVLVCLLVVITLAWSYILAGAGMDMSRMSATSDLMPQTWTPLYFLMMFVMWFVMMVAMMLPSASPMILLFSAINRKNDERGNSVVSTGVFVTGYIAAWGGFSLIATSFQWWLEEMTLLTPMMASASPLFGSALLVTAGIYQLTPLKYACLRHCRSPIDYLGHRWRNGTVGALIMGLEHGLFCLGCCWVLMVLLFYGGVMSLEWIIGLALFVLLEKVLPAGYRIGRLSGVVLIIWGVTLILQHSM